jgi:diphosphomevalonate decarboxylase
MQIKKMQAKAKAHSNIALIKYWGKRSEALNLPAVGSISITLQKLYTISSIEFDEKLEKDIVKINGKTANQEETGRVSQFLDLFRNLGRITFRSRVLSDNNFPTGAGLASSASAFASLALAANQAIGLNISNNKLSEFARIGSGSAARSIYGGFVEMNVGEKQDGSDSYAVQLANQDFWDVHVIIAVTSEEKKEIGSTAGMIHTEKTSPYYNAWIATNKVDLEDMRQSILKKDFHTLGELSEFSCLKMHSVMLSANPGLIYWNSSTLECIQAIRRLRKKNIAVYFTIDAGPQVKALCLRDDIPKIRAELEGIEGVKRIISSALGPDASVQENSL